jgi:glycosyltransferase involved in cell wall biosynthesis
MHVVFITSNKDFFDENGKERVYLRGLIEASEVLHIVVSTKRRDRHKVTKLNDHTWIYPTNSYFTFLYLFDLIHVVRFQLLWQKEFRAHVIHSDDPGIVGWVGMLLSYWYKCVWVVNIRSYYWGSHQSFLKRLTLVPIRVLFVQAYRVCVFSEITRIYLSAHINRKGIAKIVSFPQISDRGSIQQDTTSTTETKVLAHSEFKFVLLVVSEFNKTNRVSLAFNILSRLRQNKNYAHAGLIIVGRGAYKIPLKIRAAVQGLDPWVVFENPNVPIREYANIANIFLYLSGGKENEEAFINVAMARCAMIASSDEVSRGIISDGFNGYIISPATTDRFVSAIIRINEMPGLREQFKANSDMRLINNSMQTSTQVAEELKKIWEYQAAPEPMRTMPILKFHPLYPQKTPPTLYEKTTQMLREILYSPFSSSKEK